MEDDVYNGMVIPRGTLVFANVWYALQIFRLQHELTVK